MGNQIYKEISKFAEMQRNENKREKAKKKRKSVCIDPDSVIGKEIMYQTALLHEILDEIREEKRKNHVLSNTFTPGLHNCNIVHCNYEQNITRK